MMQQVLEVQQGWGLLDSGYFTKPTVTDVARTCYQLAVERRPGALEQLL